MKKVGRAASVVFGMGFMTLQALSYTAGYVTVNHAVIQSDVEDVLDVNDDGVVDEKDVFVMKEKMMDVLTFNMAGGSGFASGFWGGFRSG